MSSQNQISLAVCTLFFEKLDDTIKCIKSFLPSGMNIYILNNGSSEKSRQNLGQFCKGYDRIKIFDLPHNLGPASGRNYLVTHTKEDWLLFADNDEIIKTVDWVQKFVSHVRSNIDVEAFVPELFCLPYKVLDIRFPLVINAERAFFDTTPAEAETNCFTAGCVFLKRSLFDRHGLFDEKMFCAEDYEFCIRAILSKKPVRAMIIHDIELIHNRVPSKKTVDRNAALTRYNLKNIEDSYKHIFEKHHVILQTNWKEDAPYLMQYFTSKQSLPRKLLKDSRFVLYGRSRIKIILDLTKYWIFALRFKTTSLPLNYSLQRKNVLCVIEGLGVGGLESFFFRLAKGVRGEDYNFNMITSITPDKKVQEKFERFYDNIVTPAKIGGSNYYSSKVYYLFLQRLIQELRIGILFICNDTAVYPHLAHLKSKFRDLKIIDRINVMPYLPSELIINSVPFIDKRVCQTQKAMNSVIDLYEEYGIAKTYHDCLTVICNGVDTNDYKPEANTKGKFRARFSIPEEANIISYIGRFSDEKNPILFVEVAKALILKSSSNLKFVMAGGGRDISKVLERIKDYGLEKYFILTGEIDYVSELLNDTKILLVVSKRESIANIALEAMSVGVPVINTNVGATNELIKEGVNGFLIDQDECDELETVNAFANKVMDLLNGQIDYSSISKNARTTIINGFSFNYMASNYRLIFSESSRAKLEKKPYS